MSDDMMGGAMNMIGTGIGLGIMGLGAKSLIGSLNSVNEAAHPKKKRKSAKRKKSATKRK